MMRFQTPISRLRLVLLVWLCLAGAGFAAGPILHPGDKLPELAVGRTTYHDIVIKTVTARSVLFLHRGGMASVLLRDLAPDWQARFGYDPAAERAGDVALAKAERDRAARLAAEARARAQVEAAQVRSKFEHVLQSFGEPAELRAGGVDLRPRFRELELYVKNQGRRPSCAVFAVVSALEYLHAERTGRPEQFSEEYLIWATRRTITRPEAPDALTGDDADEGFALSEVVTALRTYGIPLERSLPNTRGRSMDGVTAPSPAVIREAQTRTEGSVHFVPGRDNATRLNNIVQALNAGLPVPIGTAWPRFRNMRAALLNRQVPGYAHAVTLVGYRCPSGKIEDATFIFKNSWGPDWGANGYGFATYAYLAKYLESAILPEVNFRD